MQGQLSTNGNDGIYVCSNDRHKGGGSVYIAMLKSNFPELFLFELEIYHVECEMNIERDIYRGKFLSGFVYHKHVQDTDVCVRFVFYPLL